MNTDEIVNAVAESFTCFGKGSQLAQGNPIAHVLKDKPPVFAAGVEVKAVVQFVLERAGIGKN